MRFQFPQPEPPAPFKDPSQDTSLMQRECRLKPQPGMTLWRQSTSQSDTSQIISLASTIPLCERFTKWLCVWVIWVGFKDHPTPFQAWTTTGNEMASNKKKGLVKDRSSFHWCDVKNKQTRCYSLKCTRNAANGATTTTVSSTGPGPNVAKKKDSEVCLQENLSSPRRERGREEEWCGEDSGCHVSQWGSWETDEENS